MIGQLLLAVILILVPVIIFKHFTRNFDYWQKRNVAYPNPVPFFGNFAEFMLLKSNFGIISNKIYNQFPDKKYVGMFIGKSPALLVRDPDLLKLIMAKDFYYFSGRGFTQPDKRELVTMHLFNLSGDDWRVLRQNLTPLFSSAKMKRMFHLMLECAEEFESLVRRRFLERDEVNINDTMSRFSMDVIGSCAFGLQMNSLSGEETPFRRAANGFFGTSFSKSIKTFLRLLVPRLYSALGLRVVEPFVNEFFLDLSRKMIKMREEKPSERQDFIDLLTEFKRRGYIEGDSIESMKPNVERRTVRLDLDDQILAAQSFVFFAAGFETSSTAMSYTLYELSKHAEIQQRVHAEIDAMLLKYEGKITYEMLQEQSYLQMVVNETLRKYPALATITRECISNYTLPDGMIVEKGVKIHIPVNALHHDPQYYPNPEEFDPERFSAEASKKRNPYTYMPFGEGQRLCIGMRFGKMQVYTGIISLLRNFTVEPCARTEKKIQLNPRSTLTTPKNHIWLKLVHRGKEMK